MLFVLVAARNLKSLFSRSIVTGGLIVFNLKKGRCIMSYEVRLHLCDSEVEGVDNYILDAAEQSFTDKEDAEKIFDELLAVFIKER